MLPTSSAKYSRSAALLLIALAILRPALSLATILWNDAPPRVVHETGGGVDILGGKVRRDDAANDVLYFKFHVNPLSDVATEPYYAGFALFAGTNQSFAVGNAWEAWGYSAFGTLETGPSNRLAGEFNLKSSDPEPSGLGVFYPYELPRHDQERTIVFRIQYVRGGNDTVTVWLSPNLARGATDQNQREAITTKFKANGSFDQLRLLHGGNGNGWIFSDMAVATSFNDFVVVRFWQTFWFDATAVVVVLSMVVSGVRLVEKRRFRRQLELAEQSSAIERERSRIARDLHDELGSALTQISMMSDLLRRDTRDPAQTLTRAAKISQTATETVRALEEIVWALRPGSDTLQSLADYISHFATELFEGDSRIDCRLDFPAEMPAKSLPPEMRHNVFLIVKEALTNTYKHAKATEVLVLAKVSDSELQIVVEDNGVGCVLPDAGTGTRNGLNNMHRRADSVAGALQVESTPGKGTRVSLTVSLAATSPAKHAIS